MYNDFALKDKGLLFMSMIRFQSRISNNDLSHTEKSIRTKLDNAALSMVERDSFIQILLQSEYTKSVLRAALSGWERDMHRQYSNILELKEIIRVANECIRCERLLHEEAMDKNISELQKKVDEKTQKLNIIQPAHMASTANLNLAKDSFAKCQSTLRSGPSKKI